MSLGRLFWCTVAGASLAACHDAGSIAAPAASPDPQYGRNAAIELVDLGTFGGASASAFAVSADGDVVGARVVAGANRAWHWSPRNGFTDLGTLGGPRAMARGVNARGQVVGLSPRGSGLPESAFLWTARDGMRDLLPTVPGRSDGWAINERGTVTGILGFVALHTDNPDRPRAYVWSEQEGVVLLGNLPGGDGTVGRAINELGQVIGEANVGPNSAGLHGFLWTPNRGMRDLGLLGPIPSSAGPFALNNRGSVVGATVAAPNAPPHAFYWTEPTGLVELLPPGAFRSVATGINAREQVVGSFMIPPGISRAFLWTPADGFTVLPDLGGGASAFAINDRGEVVGAAGPPGGATHAVLWRLN